MMRGVIFFLALLSAVQAHAGLFVFVGEGDAPFKLSLDSLEAVEKNGNDIVRLSLRIDKVSKPVRSAGIRCSGESVDGSKWSFAGEFADLEVGEARDLVLDGTLVNAFRGKQPSLVRCNVIDLLLAG